MQRVKILGGILTGGQWRALARIAAEFTPGSPLHLSTRQDIELHDVRAERVAAVQQAITEAGLTGLGACGDTVRNITVCPCSGVRGGAPDLVGVAWEIRRMLEATDGIFELPRKFKISLSACSQACGQPWINDLGLAAVPRDGRWGFRVVAGGSLGPRPGVGMELFGWLAAADVMPLVLAAIEVFNMHGDRKHRQKARLRHVRERLGNQAFAGLVGESFDRLRNSRTWPRIELQPPSVAFDAEARLTFPNGDVSPEAAIALGELADRDDLRVRIDTHHRVAVFGRDADVLRDAIARQPVLHAAARPQATIVACPGRRWCKRGLTDTNGMAERIRRELGNGLPPPTAAGTESPAPAIGRAPHEPGQRLPSEITVCISGCPNNCAQSAVAPIGLVGGLAGGREVYNVLVGGGFGRSDKLAVPVASRLVPDSVIDTMARNCLRDRLEADGTARVARPADV